MDDLKDRLVSRKLWITVISAGIILFNKKLGLGLSDSDILAVSGIVLAYVGVSGAVEYSKS